ncbi:MAG: trypsin-like peptidase domain-containing protein [Geminicoccaceae bacterium]
MNVRKAGRNAVKIDWRDARQGYRGSGAYLGNGLVVTAAHVVQGHHPNQMGKVTFPLSGGTHEAMFVKGDSKWDIAVLWLTKKPHPPGGLAIAEKPAKLNEPVYPIGWSLGRPAFRPGRIDPSGRLGSYSHQAAAQGKQEWQAILPGADGPIEGGDSGGPVIDGNARLQGIVWGGNGRDTTFVRLTCLQRFLLPWNAKLHGGGFGQVPSQWGTQPGGGRRLPQETPIPDINISAPGDGGGLSLQIPPKPDPLDDIRKQLDEQRDRLDKQITESSQRHDEVKADVRELVEVDNATTLLQSDTLKRIDDMQRQLAPAINSNAAAIEDLRQRLAAAEARLELPITLNVHSNGLPPGVKPPVRRADGVTTSTAKLGGPDFHIGGRLVMEPTEK